MLKAYRYRLCPTPTQATLLQKSFGCVRWVYNHALASRIEQYQTPAKVWLASSR